MEERICRMCGETFVPRRGNQYACSKEECQKKRMLENKRACKERLREIPSLKVCKVCGKVYKKGNCLRGCSPECDRILRAKDREERKEPKPIKRCKVCGCQYSGQGDYCSQSCQNADEDGSARRPFTEPIDGKMGTADLIRKWHEEGWRPEKIAHVLTRDVRQVREVLENA